MVTRAVAGAVARASRLALARRPGVTAGLTTTPPTTSTATTGVPRGRRLEPGHRVLYTAVLRSAAGVDAAVGREGFEALPPREHARLLAVLLQSPLPLGALAVPPTVGGGADAVPPLTVHSKGVGGGGGAAVAPWSAVATVRAVARAIPPDTPPEVVTDAACLGLRHLSARGRILASLVPSTSVVTEAAGVRVTVVSSLVGGRRGNFLHKYDVKVENRRPEAVLLLSRRWLSVDLDGRAVAVDGRGVVGLTPLIQPGESFGYGSGVAVQADWAVMRGSYQVLVMGGDGGSGGGGEGAEWGEGPAGREGGSALVEVPVGPFLLAGTPPGVAAEAARGHPIPVYEPPVAARAAVTEGGGGRDRIGAPPSAPAKADVDK
ncbi:hypothetical protein I4F81_001985 [Pyropia yezoensis]|uniref:Uncharacterized protein n=1 Tax=Pyropia yezoensis TaxID=2788 RepID=A0ACC3BNT5_PYRYE|nr:hypothetical protein I4F81_001985 [Neopyropia yezoensis]